MRYILMVEARKSSQPYAQAQQLPCFSEDHLKTKGTYLQIDLSELESEKPQLFYSHPNGEIYVGDAANWLKSLKSGSVDLIFADPPYNVKKAEWDTFEFSRRVC